MRALVESYPNPGQLLDLLAKVTPKAHASFIRLWLTEGIPFAFKDCPAFYEAVRTWLAGRLNIHPKEITLIGSARIGFSLAPAPKLGKAYGRHSDLDFCLVSAALFDSAATTFRDFSKDFDSGKTNPRSASERSLWLENIAVVGRGIPQGFIDPGKIPTWDAYPVAQQFANTLWSLRKKFELTPEWLAPLRASARVYKSWDALVSRFVYNLGAALASRPSTLPGLETA